jgi:CRP-like cAMP-binding protein
MKSKAEPPFDPKVFLAKADGGRTLSEHRMNETLFMQGDPADSVFYIQRGKVKVIVNSPQGKEAVVAILGPDEFCGEGCLAGQPRRMATATTMTDCEIMRVEKAAMIRVLHDEPAFSEMFVAHLLARTIRVEEDLVDQLFNSSEKRLARALLLLANFGKEGKPEPIIARVSQETLALTDKVSYKSLSVDVWPLLRNAVIRGLRPMDCCDPSMRGVFECALTIRNAQSAVR